ncbi:MAG: hypothetical protein JXR91_06650 [Deltaproteobacteria bacterium]|nr:hypothetical protein [Deltaproteobacteria bacterium]
MTIYRLLFPGTSFLINYIEADNHQSEYTIDDFNIKTSGRVIPAKMYTPVKDYKRTIVLVHGVHSDGYKEERLVHFASVLTRQGFRVFTPDIEDLRDYNIVVRAVDDIEKATLWLLNDSGKIKGDEKIGLWGISFAGGLCLHLAASQQFKKRISSTFSFGGHGNLDSTIDYLITGQTEGRYMAPHVYGQAVLVRRFADKLVPLQDVQPLKDTILNYLQGNYKLARKMSETLPDNSRLYTKLIFERDVKELGKLLKKYKGNTNTDKALSAVKGDPPPCKVFLLHGSKDNVIPPGELNLIATWADKGGHNVRSLISPLINHVELEEKPGAKQLFDYYNIIRFWTELLRNA